MQITETTTEGLKREFRVVIPAADIEQRVTSRLTEIGRSARLPGFRPGKIPMTVLRKRYGSAVMGEVLERAVNDTSGEALREQNLRPALQPKVEIVAFNEGTDLEFKLAVEVLPEIQPMDFTDLKLERVGQLSGFALRHYFQRSFKQLAGVTPDAPCLGTVA